MLNFFNGISLVGRIHKFPGSYVLFYMFFYEPGQEFGNSLIQSCWEIYHLQIKDHPPPFWLLQDGHKKGPVINGMKLNA